MTTSLQGISASSARVRFPTVGAWTAEVTLVSPAALTGQVTLQILDLALQGTIVRGGVIEGEASYLVTAGAGGWRSNIAPAAYRNDVGVKASTVLQDAATAAGEKLALGPDSLVGLAFVRPEGPAWDLLTLLAPGWWVDPNGVTQVVPRSSAPVAAPYRTRRWDRWAGLRIMAADSAAAFQPGAVLEGDVIEELVVAVDHNTTRLEVRTAAAPSRLRATLARIVRGLLAQLGILQVFEYRVVSQATARVDLQIVKPTDGLPVSLSRVNTRPTAGFSCTHTPGSLVLVAFVRGLNSRPFIAFAGEVGADRTLPSSSTLDATASMTLAPTASGAVALAGSASSLALGAGDTNVQIAGGNEVVSAPEAVGRVVRYGDSAVLGTATGVLSLPGSGPCSRVKA